MRNSGGHACSGFMLKGGDSTNTSLVWGCPMGGAGWLGPNNQPANGLLSSAPPSERASYDAGRVKWAYRLRSPQE